MSVRFRVCLAVWAATVACSIACGTIRADEFDTGDGWTIEITPRVTTPEQEKLPVTAPVAVPAATVDAEPATEAPLSAADYRRIYQSIPFSRAEYNVNPSYRHDSTMEILTGNARHQTTLQHSTVPVPPPRPQSHLLPYRYNSPRHGLNYYFYFPYWNYRGIF